MRMRTIPATNCSLSVHRGRAEYRICLARGALTGRETVGGRPDVLRQATCAAPSLVVCGFFVLMSTAIAAHCTSPSAVEFLVSFNHQVWMQLGSGSLDAAQRKTRFGRLLDKGLDMNAIGEDLLGRRWGNSTPPTR
jgi:hypothetical protein